VARLPSKPGDGIPPTDPHGHSTVVAGPDGLGDGTTLLARFSDTTTNKLTSDEVARLLVRTAHTIPAKRKIDERTTVLVRAADPPTAKRLIDDGSTVVDRAADPSPASDDSATVLVRAADPPTNKYAFDFGANTVVYPDAPDLRRELDDSVTDPVVARSVSPDFKHSSDDSVTARRIGAVAARKFERTEESVTALGIVPSAAGTIGRAMDDSVTAPRLAADTATNLKSIGELGFTLEPGTMLGEYEVERLIGEGAMGAVFAAVHPVIRKRVAIKVLKRELCANPRSVQRFVNEARVVNEIGHRNIVDVFAFGEMPDGRHYFVMEWLRGETLHARLSRSTLTIREMCAIIRPLARALVAAHDHGVIHRDLKPDNVFLVDDGGEQALVKLLDFGIAKLGHADHRIDRTAEGAIIGTPQYMAPEQAKGYLVDGRADVYSLGCMMFEMLAGRPPFVADNAAEMLAMHLMDPVPRVSQYASVPVELDELLLAMLAKEPLRRPSLDSVHAVVDRARHNDSPSLEPSRRPRIQTRIDDGAPHQVPGPHAPPIHRDGVTSSDQLRRGVAREAVAVRGRAGVPAPPPQSARRQRGRWLLVGGCCLVVAIALLVAVMASRTSRQADSPAAPTTNHAP